MMTKSLGEMTDAEFEAYLRKHKLTGMAAVAAGMKRRRQQAEAGK